MVCNTCLLYITVCFISIQSQINDSYPSPAASQNFYIEKVLWNVKLVVLKARKQGAVGFDRVHI